MRKMFLAVVMFLYIRLGYRRVFLRGYDKGLDMGFQDAVDTVQDWYVCGEPDDAYYN